MRPLWRAAGVEGLSCSSCAASPQGGSTTCGGALVDGIRCIRQIMAVNTRLRARSYLGVFCQSATRSTHPSLRAASSFV
ncbi:uncharacterized protein SCHCODRAFT_02627362 [Schizophyllum commune H4-8]|uniref:uncharacterized protein n=1 Tax=Schizophyllum commune (strain H4-8 / FGSC 9210) TaxID=578458 RepID=UPI00215EFA72|nr:uncharacterized protein SCHCODRAFT_02627362 [Schizophyllum commune H4-8]KAI5892873.1 hypothetical protein SCHCODRAFT_02627362 [Schizophyllum commune H4-8]